MISRLNNDSRSYDLVKQVKELSKKELSKKDEMNDTKDDKIYNENNIIVQ